MFLQRYYYFCALPNFSVDIFLYSTFVKTWYKVNENSVKNTIFAEEMNMLCEKLISKKKNHDTAKSKKRAPGSNDY